MEASHRPQCNAVGIIDVLVLQGLEVTLNRESAVGEMGRELLLGKGYCTPVLANMGIREVPEIHP